MTKTTQNTPLLHNKTINSNVQKSQEMTQLMLEKGIRDSLDSLEKAHLSEIDDFLKIQMNNAEAFDKDKHDERHLKRHKHTPNYRKMHCYVKSIKQYKRERERRKTVMQLSGKGRTYPQIAKELGISERTVARDMKKQKRYRIGQFHKALRRIEQDQIDKFHKETEHLNNAQRFRLLTDLLVKQEPLFKVREYNRHAIKIIIDMNDLTDGCPSIRFWPQPPWSLTKPIHFDFYVQHGEQTKHIGGLIQK